MHSLKRYIVEVEVLRPNPSIHNETVFALNLKDAVRTAAEDMVEETRWPVTAVCDGFTVDWGLDGPVDEYFDPEYGTGGEHDYLT